MTTHLIHAPIDMRKFNRWAGKRTGKKGLIQYGSFDAGYALHVLLSAMFGKSVLQPFRLFSSERRRNATLYGYASVDDVELRRTADATATPDCLDVVNPSEMRSKRMPPNFERGRRLGFDLRLRPVRRLHRELADDQLDRPLHKGAEVDAFRLEVIRKFPSGWSDPVTASVKAGVTRESVYREWLSERFGDAAAVKECSLVSFKRTRAVRGNGKGPEGPDTILHGTLIVSNQEKFGEILRNGIGRHRAYGYGMLLLRPPNRKAQEQ